MKTFLTACLVFVFAGIIRANIVSDPNIVLSQQQKQEISDLFTILLAVYDDDLSLIPDDPNEIFALETSEDPRDQLVREILRMIRCVPDSNSLPLDENSFAVMDEQSISAVISNTISDINTESLNEEATANSSEMKLSEQERRIGLTQSMEQIEELSNPLGSRILENKTYRITSLPLEIEGHVVFPAGAKLIAPYDPNSNIIEVMPGGLLDMGKALNYSDPNYPDILPSVEILPEDPNQYFRHNNIGIYIWRGANPSCRIYNTIVSHCRIGILADEALTNPIQNVITFGCYDGIYLFAPNTILDSEFWLYGAVSEGFYNYIGAGIYINLDGGGYPYPSAEINRVVTYGGDVGIYLESHDLDPNAADPNQTVGSLEVVNSIMFYNYYCGIYKTEGQTNIDLGYCAFGDNYWDSNFELPFTGCVGLSYDPFYILSDEDRRLFMAPWSEAIDAGYGMAEDGMGTCDYQPDIGPMDIGCHFPVGKTGSFGIPSSPADFNADGIVDKWDLEWMDWCMGAIGDPNIVKFDTNYDSQINMPDFGLMSFDYGYSYDPNESNNNDPNCERSDFNGDHRVDLEDVRILADYWLTKVFDPYRICSLCNLYRNPDPNEPEIDEIIDSRDYDAFMAEWGKVSYSGCAISFRKEPNQILEPNDLSEGITIFPEGFPPSTISIFAQIDGQPTELTYPGFDEQPSIAIPTDEYGNGWHTLTVGGYTMDGGCWMENTKVRFQNSLYFSSLQKVYEPNEPILFAAYNTDAGDATVAVYGDGGQVLWSQSFTGNTITGSIPANIAANHLIDYVNFNSSSGASVNKATVPDVSRGNVDKDVKALMILPDTELFELDPNVRVEVLQAFIKRGITPLRLEGQEATWENVARYGQYGFVKYIYFGGHGNYRYGEGKDEILRTRTKFADGWVVSSKRSEFPSPPAWCKSLPEPLESNIRTWASMKFDRLEWFYNDGCFGGRLKIDGAGNLIEGQPGQIGLFDGPHSDMSLALNLDDTYKTRCYHGWWQEGWVGWAIPVNEHSTYQEWGKDVWFKLGEGDNLDDALKYAIHETKFYGPGSAVQNYRLKGQGDLTILWLSNR